MKTRLGFVSNSSSSSYVLIIEKDEYERALDVVHPYVKAVVLAMREKKEEKFMGKDIMLVGSYCDAGGYDNFEDLDVDYDGTVPDSKWDDGSMRASEAFDEVFAGALRDEKVIRFSMDS